VIESITRAPESPDRAVLVPLVEGQLLEVVARCVEEPLRGVDVGHLALRTLGKIDLQLDECLQLGRNPKRYYEVLRDITARKP
jgi:hypothetical protein